MNFKVGDIIKGTENHYGVTNKDMYAAEVVKLFINTNQIEIKVLDHHDKNVIGKTYIVTSSFFELCDIFDTYINKSNNKQMIVKIIEAPFGARGVNETYGILIDSKTADKIFEEKTFCHQGLGEKSNYFFIPFNSKFYDTKYYNGEIWGLGKDFTEIEFKDITTGIIYNKKPKKMTIEEIEKELGYKFEIVEEN